MNREQDDLDNYFHREEKFHVCLFFNSMFLMLDYMSSIVCSSTFNFTNWTKTTFQSFHSAILNQKPFYVIKSW